VVDHWHVGVGRVSINGLTLDIVKEHLQIVILRGDDRSVSNSGALLGIEGLQTFPVIVLSKADIIDIIVELGILLNALVEALERIIEIGLLSEPLDDGIKAHVNSIIDLSSVVLQLIVVHSMLLVCAIEALIDAVHMNSPEVVNSLVNLAVIGVLAGDGRSNEPEEHILCLKLKDGYTKFKVSTVTSQRFLA
jgi:hypothetical protein